MTDELGSHVYKSQVGAACQGFTEGVKTFKLNPKVIFGKQREILLTAIVQKQGRLSILACLIHV